METPRRQLNFGGEFGTGRGTVPDSVNPGGVDDGAALQQRATNGTPGEVVHYLPQGGGVPREFQRTFERGPGDGFRGQPSPFEPRTAGLQGMPGFANPQGYHSPQGFANPQGFNNMQRSQGTPGGGVPRAHARCSSQRPSSEGDIFHALECSLHDRLRHWRHYVKSLTVAQGRTNFCCTQPRRTAQRQGIRHPSSGEEPAYRTSRVTARCSNYRPRD